MPCRSVPGGLQFFGWGSPILGGLRGVKGDPPIFFFDFCFLWGHPPPRDQTPEYGQRSAGTHPTGMYSCIIIYLQFPALSATDGISKYENTY